ncbi:MAG: HNH endonuclease [Bacteroidota bacterium]
MSTKNETIRIRAFAWLAEQVSVCGELLPRPILQRGFDFEGERIPLMSPQGIFRPKVLTDGPLSITTAPSGPYDDEFTNDDLLLYRYRGTDPSHRDNVGLCTAMMQQIPLVYFHGVVPGKYLAVWPVYIVGDNPGGRTFTVAVDDMASVRMSLNAPPTQELYTDAQSFGRRAYITRQTRQRLHQQGFRERVLQAYREQCACCRLKHGQLLDAAHIVPDSDPEGIPIINNGIALCKLHHAAFDTYIIGITPDYKIEVRPDILSEADGPMLRHGLQGMNGQVIMLPRTASQRPDRDLLDKRYQQFRGAV